MRMTRPAAFFGFLDYVVDGGRGQARPHCGGDGCGRDLRSRRVRCERDCASRWRCCCGGRKRSAQCRPDVTATAVMALAERDLPGRVARRRHSLERPARHRLRRLAHPGRLSRWRTALRSTSSGLAPQHLRCRARPDLSEARARRISPQVSTGLCKESPPSHSSTWPAPIPWRGDPGWPPRCRPPRRAGPAPCAPPPPQPGRPAGRRRRTVPSMGVRVTPGATALTRRPSSPHSAAATCTNIDSAALDAE